MHDYCYFHQSREFYVANSDTGEVLVIFDASTAAILQAADGLSAGRLLYYRSRFFRSNSPWLKPRLTPLAIDLLRSHLADLLHIDRDPDSSPCNTATRRQRHGR